ncbi:hypothetical protein TSOC_004418 [Tetrabaena socialis]|uniref:Uncharacterized protein n=1 Tax=Tetrabaena socialis TaxID=47790 RepID=A0A2J8A937_9CHLO|nr:hypothetical protein TSOC_004418 [Tetrabaena socialis]|eukprot:PNH09011.1 hypothetical protein TSOC_004418 [Tetrabaena socialis]
MAELAALEELLLSGFDVNALLAGAPGLSGLEAQLVEAQHLQGGLGQQLGWPGPGNQDMYVAQDYQQTLAAEHRLRQVQVATALQQLQNLQQQQSDLAALQQQLQGLTGGRASAFGRSRTSDLESYGRRPGYDVSSALAPPALDYLQLSALQAMPDAQRGVQGVLMQHNLPVRSFSSEHLVAGRTGRQQPNINTAAPGIAASGTTSGPPGGKRPPFRQPSGLGPNGRGQGRPADGRRHRATAKAPSWASDDWNPVG